MCLYCLNLTCDTNRVAHTGVSRRHILRQAAAMRVALPLAAAAPRIASAAGRGGLVPADFKKGMKDIIVRARSPELAGYRFFEITGNDLPWTNLGLEAAEGQQVTFLVTGRMWVARQADLWFRSGLVFHARTGGQRPIYSLEPIRAR